MGREKEMSCSMNLKVEPLNEPPYGSGHERRYFEVEEATSALARRTSCPGPMCARTVEMRFRVGVVVGSLARSELMQNKQQSIGFSSYLP